MSTQPQLVRHNPMPLSSEGEVVSVDVGSNSGRSFDVSTDGQRFILAQAVGRATAGASLCINIALNWLEESKDRVPVS